jgi:hypothetical protein
MNSATRTVVTAMAIILGVAGVEHGVGEALQGSVAPAGLMFPSWPDSEFFRIVAGEPAMSIVPNLLVTGILAILVSLGILVWTFWFIDGKFGGLVLIALSIVALLVGGGIAPVLLGIIAGAAATRINAPLTWWRDHVGIGLRRFLGKLWLPVFIVCLFAWLMLFPGLSILSLFLTLDGPTLIPIMALCALGFLLLAIVTALAGDSVRKEMESLHS